MISKPSFCQVVANISENIGIPAYSVSLSEINILFN